MKRSGVMLVKNLMFLLMFLLLSSPIVNGSEVSGSQIKNVDPIILSTLSEYKIEGEFLNGKISRYKYRKLAAKVNGLIDAVVFCIRISKMCNENYIINTLKEIEEDISAYKKILTHPLRGEIFDGPVAMFKPPLNLNLNKLLKQLIEIASDVYAWYQKDELIEKLKETKWDPYKM